SKFGVQLDSLTDLVVFGVTPAAVLFLLVRSDAALAAEWSSYGWALHACLALFAICSSLRLAKFNVMADEGGPGIFFGMPTTLAGGLLGLFLLIGLQHELPKLLAALPLMALAFALLMVSNLPLPKVAKRDTTAGNVFQAVNLVLCYVCGFLRIYPEYLLAVTLGYASVGFIWGMIHRQEFRPGKTENDDGSDGDDSHGDLAVSGA
ncbi:MAG: hypothetical protein KC457_09870, partial [Myxococcales bacterium]|nr:hypothetical protein [Myxococcales bacterium]